MYTRTIVEESPDNIAVMDVFSRLIQDRIIFIDDAIDDDLSNGVIAQLLYLDSLNNETINVYINSPGGSVSSGLAIYDVAKLIKSPIKTICIGTAGSMAAILMLIGQERCGLKHSKFMLHQPSGGVGGAAEDIRIVAKEITSIENSLYTIIKEHTTFKDVKNLFNRDYWLNSEEAFKFNLITKIL
jgi:ATP-dependent Clp protease protease subunit